MVCMLTTKDNPFDPFTQFSDWYAFDSQKGYHSPEFLARMSRTSPDLSPKDYEEEVERAIDDIISIDITQMFKKVYKKEEN